MKNYPKISIITPSYNQGQYLEETILSVLNQNYPNLEYIVIDGGSIDESVNIIKKYKDKITFWVSEKDRGQTHAINKGLAIATGEILGYLNSDDCLMLNALNIIAETYLTIPFNKKLLLVGDCIMGERIEENNKILSHHCENWTQEIVANGYGIAPQPSMFWTKADLLFDEELHFNMDYSYWYNLLKKEYKAIRIPHVLAFYRIHKEAKGSTIIDRMWIEHSYLSIKWIGDFEKPSEKLKLLRTFNYKIRNYFMAEITVNAHLWTKSNILTLTCFQLFNFPRILFHKNYLKFIIKRLIS